ncbi:hypothetical protein ACROYT_G000057 [Oculina patagonica]
MFKPVTSRLDTQIEATKKLNNKGLKELDPLPEFPIDEDEDEDEMPNYPPPTPIDEAQTEDEYEMPDFDPPPPIDEAQTEDEDEMPDFDPPPSIEQKRKKWDTSANQKELDRQRESLAEERRQIDAMRRDTAPDSDREDDEWEGGGLANNYKAIYYRDPEKLIEKLDVICGSINAGNTSYELKNQGGAISKRKPPSAIEYDMRGSGIDIQKHLSKLGELHMRTPTGKKYNYCGPGTKLEERLASNDPKYRDPINNLDSICQMHDIAYSNSKSLADKHKADDLMLKRISKIPFKDRPWGTTGVQALIASKRKIGLGIKKEAKKRKTALSKNDWSQQLADELHKPIRRKFKTRRVISNGIDEIWSADLVFMDKLSKWNKGYKYLLTIIDVFSKFAWAIQLKDKKGASITSAFNNIIINDKRKPEYLWVDKGSEFYNKTFKEWLKQNDIKMYSTFNEGKAVVIERFNRTLKNKMYKQFTIQGNTQYLEMLPILVKEYNNTKHSSIKMTPTEASKEKNQGIVYLNLYGDMEPLSATPKFKVGDKVRISKYKRKVFDKGYTPNWSEEIFIVDKIQYTNPITYKLKDLNNEEIQGSFYESELLKAKQEVFRIDKVIRRNYKKKQALVKWKGYSDEFNSWIPIKDLQHI